jgi:virginiamycin A acetyltransferase
MLPGLAGDHLRIAFYHLTLKECSLSSRISFGSFFAHPEAVVAPGVYIGSYSILGICTLGERTQIASGVHVLSGRRQHSRSQEGDIQGAESGEFSRVTIGANCWIGAGSIVMADVGEGTTIGAGSIVAKPIPANCVAVGNPAKVIKTAGVPSEASLTEA